MAKNDTSESTETVGKGDDSNFLKELMSAAINGEGRKVQRKIIEYSTKHEINPFSVLKDFKDESKRSAIHFACQSSPLEEGDDHVDIVKLLLEKTKFPSSALEAIVQLKDIEGLTPLMIACQNMNSKTHERIKCILGIDPNAAFAKSKTEATPLHFAAGAGASKEVIDLLYSHAKDSLNSFTAKGSTPLHWASGDPPPKNYSDSINAVLDLGADVNSYGEGGIPALIVALASSNDVHAKLLTERGADRGTILGGGVTVFHMAADLNLQNALKAMLDADVDADADKTEDSTSAKCLKMENAKGETPLDLAAQRGNFECFKLLNDEKDEEKAKQAMTAIQKKWNDKAKEQNQDKKDNKPKAIVIDEEADAKKAAAMLISNPPSISSDDKAKAAEFKSKGNSHFVKGEWDEAITEYSAAIELNPLDETYYSNRSACYIKMKKNNQALNDAVVCRYLKPKWAKGCYRLSVARLAQDRYEDAAVSAWEGLQMDEGNPELETLVTKCIKKGRQEHKEKNKKK